MTARIARLHFNPLMMTKLTINQSLMTHGLYQSQLISTIFDGEGAKPLFIKALSN